MTLIIFTIQTRCSSCGKKRCLGGEGQVENVICSQAGEQEGYFTVGGRLDEAATFKGMSMMIGMVFLVFGACWLLSVLAVDHRVTSNYLRVSIRNHLLRDAPSCQHSIGQVELLNMVR